MLNPKANKPLAVGGLQQGIYNRRVLRFRVTPMPSHRPVVLWLFVCCFMVFATLVVGGVTRLTHSGLSIVEWQPLLGAIPPLSAADWQAVFEKYRQSPEFIHVNHAMDLAGFKVIFWWEWTHRLLGRLIGAVFFLPLLGFWIGKRLPDGLGPKLAGIFLLGGLQGALGWYMVKSGLVDDPRVSQYRLAAHLGLAFLIFGLLLWVALGLSTLRSLAGPDPRRAVLGRLGGGLLLLVFVMVLSGALVAGTHAGAIYNTFPSMGGHWLPPELFDYAPAWKAPFEHHTTIQFDHRLIAGSLFLLLPVYCLKVATRVPAARTAALAVIGMLAVQLGLGIATLVNGVPVALAATHQAGAMALFGLVVWLNHRLRVEA